MSTDRIDTHAATDSVSPVVEANGNHGDSHGASCRDVMILRARCSKLRNWLRVLLDEPAATGVLSEASVAELRGTDPAIGEVEAHDLIGRLARGGDAPATHPLAPDVTDAN